jgi:hypothetical protein
MNDLTQSFPVSKPIREERKVVTDTDPATGTVTYEGWRNGDKWDRADGPTYIRRNAVTRTVTYEGWHKNDKLDRADGPAYIRRDAATGNVTRDEWCKNGEQFEPSPEVRAAWLQKEATENAARIARLAVPSASASPAPAPPHWMW